ncbi:large ribosomal subunit protein bL9-like [Corticium candelabrum]|uniref:large ribosomal subunit protein bL9-like n=1 Tax=Corticium candelabrum TaxID=121492 RepID=UPI002E340C2B|nr:large ribosomal subunit protein bL9-like [Corticium candelabrum]
MSCCWFRRFLWCSQVRSLATRQESRPWKQKPNRDVKISVILAEDVVGLGRRGEEMEVKRGFARNYLIPGKKAVYYTEHNKKLFEEEKIVDGSQVLDSVTQKLVDYISKSVVKIERRDDPRGWALFRQHISMACRKQLRLHVPLDKVRLEKPLSSFGIHEVMIKVGNNIDTPIRVEVTPQGSRPAASQSATQHTTADKAA